MNASKESRQNRFVTLGKKLAHKNLKKIKFFLENYFLFNYELIQT